MCAFPVRKGAMRAIRYLGTMGTTVLERGIIYGSLGQTHASELGDEDEAAKAWPRWDNDVVSGLGNVGRLVFGLGESKIHILAHVRETREAIKYRFSVTTTLLVRK